jgi:hypothetical protein
MELFLGGNNIFSVYPVEQFLIKIRIPEPVYFADCKPIVTIEFCYLFLLFFKQPGYFIIVRECFSQIKIG